MPMYNTIDEYWSVICHIHEYTKKFSIWAEELSSPDYETFLQPIKEHRDAWDHIVRVYSGEGISKGNSYRLTNMSKALGHEFRAFFDAADWLSIVCRKRILDVLTPLSYEEIKSQFPEYDEYKQAFNSVPRKIANARIKKDIGDDKIRVIVDSYAELVEDLEQKTEKILLIFGVGF